MAEKRPNYAKREFISVKDEVRSLLDAGHSAASAYDELIEAKKITMTYRTFARYVSVKKEPRKPRIPKTSTQQEMRENKKVNSYAKEQLGVDPSDVKALLKPAT